MNNGFLWWGQNKDKLGLVPALIFWVVSILCFVFGLAFENPTGVVIGGLDLSLVIALFLGLANTLIQIIGNDSTKEDMGTVMWMGWIASYLFGIGSNVNFLLNTINLAQPILKVLVCVGLGTMIEVMPERLFVVFLKSLVFSHKTVRHEQRDQRHNNFREAKGQRVQQDTRGEALMRGNPPTPVTRYHLISNPRPDVPEFLQNRVDR